MLATSLKRRSLVSSSWVSLWVRKLRRLKRLPSGQYLTYSISSSFRSSAACQSIMLKMLTRICARRRPYFMPFARGKGSKMSLLNPIMPHWFLCSVLTIFRKLWEQPSDLRISHISVLLTKTKALVRWTKAAYSPWSYHWHFSRRCLRKTPCLSCLCWLRSQTGSRGYFPRRWRPPAS